MSEIIGNRYQLVKLIGKGGMADVYLALDTILNREVAVKILHQDMSNDPISLERFRREASASTKLSHPNIVDVYDVGDDNNKHYIVMEYVKGYTLKQLINKRGAIPFRESVWLMKQLASALMEAHRNGIIHRDIKSQNVLIKPDGTVKIADFGIAQANGAIHITHEDSVLGSVHYIAPELTKGESASMQSDIYALGIVFYELLTASLPFTGETAVSIALSHIKGQIPSVREFNSAIPQSVENIIIKATAKSKMNRYENMALMLKDLNACLKPEHLNDSKIILKSDLETEEADTITKTETVVEKKSKNIKSKLEKGMLTVFVVGVTILSIILLLVILYFNGIIGSSKNKMVKVPDISNMTPIEASDVLEGFDLNIDLANIERVMTDDIPSGKIIYSIPEAGTEVSINTKLKVVVSDGMYSIMKNYVGYNLDDAKKELSSLNINVVAVPVSSEKTPGTIISQSGLMEGDKFNSLTTNSVSFEYSEYKSITIPFNLLGLSIEEVDRNFTEMGFKVKTEEIDKSVLSEEEQLKYTEPYKVVRISPNQGNPFIQETDNYITLYYFK